MKSLIDNILLWETLYYLGLLHCYLFSEREKIITDKDKELYEKRIDNLDLLVGKLIEGLTNSFHYQS